MESLEDKEKLLTVLAKKKKDRCETPRPVVEKGSLGRCPNLAGVLVLVLLVQQYQQLRPYLEVVVVVVAAADMAVVIPGVLPYILLDIRAALLLVVVVQQGRRIAAFFFMEEAHHPPPAANAAARCGRSHAITTTTVEPRFIHAPRKVTTSTNTPFRAAATFLLLLRLGFGAECGVK